MRNITKVIKGLGTTNIISVKSDDDNVEKVLSDIEMLIQGYDRLWSIYSPDSLVTTLNKKGEVYTFSSNGIIEAVANALDLQFTNNNEQLASSGKGHKKR